MSDSPYGPNYEPLAEGIFPAIPFEAYRAIKALNSHSIMAMRRSPSHVLAELERTAPDKPSWQMQLGSAFDAHLFEPQAFKELVHEDRSDVSKNSKVYKEWRASLPAGAIVLTREQLSRIQRMRDALMGKRVIADMLREGWPQLTLLWKDRVYGCWCKARLDWAWRVNGSYGLCDLKTAADGSQWGFVRAISRYQYDIQAAFYIRGWRALTGQAPAEWRWVVVENDMPHAAAAYRGAAEDIGRAGDRLDAWLERYARCLETGDWPDYPDEVIDTGTPWGDVEVEEIEDDIPY